MNNPVPSYFGIEVDLVSMKCYALNSYNSIKDIIIKLTEREFTLSILALTVKRPEVTS